MAEARLRHQWDQTAEIVARSLQVWGAKVEAQELNPYRRPSRPAALPKVNIADLKGIFFGG